MQKTIITMPRCLLDMVKCVTDHTELWDEAVLTDNLLRNRIFSKSSNMGNMTPWEGFIRKKSDLSTIRSIGSKALVHVPRQWKTGKLTDRSTRGIMVG